MRVGLVGLGRIGRLHADNLAARCPSAELAALFDLDGGLAARLGAELGVPVAASFEEICSDRSLEAVVVATSTGSHAELAMGAARAGKHVFCEKPIALDRATTVEAVEMLAASGVVFQVGFNRRFAPDWVLAAERIRAGELGVPYLFRTSQRDKSAPPAGFLAGSGGIFLDMAIHDFDLARFLVGEVVEVSALGAALSDPAFAQIGDLDTAVVTLRFESGALGVIDTSRVAGYGYECATEVMGSRATVRVRNPPLNQLEWRSAGRASEELPRDFEQSFLPAFVLELEAFARCVLEGTPPRATGWDALAAFDLASAAASSWRAGQPVRTVPERVPGGVRYLVEPAG